jgi:hypothetical protein
MLRPLNTLERKTLESTSLTAKYIHLVVCIGALLFYLSIWIDYIVYGNSIITLLKWFSVWNVVFGTFLSIFGIFLTSWIIVMIKDAEVSKWIGVIEIIRDCLYMIALQLFVLVDISFWIAFFCGPYFLSWASIASHSFNLLVILAMIFTTNVRTTVWSMFASIYVVAFYVTYHVWYYYRFREWIYETLGFSHGYIWFGLVVGIPIGLVLIYGGVYIFNYIKNRMAAYLLGIKEFSHQTLIDYYHPANSTPKKPLIFGQTALENFRIRTTVPAFFELIIVCVVIIFYFSTIPNDVLPVHWSIIVFNVIFVIFVSFKFLTYVTVFSLIWSQTPNVADHMLHRDVKRYFTLFVSIITFGFSFLVASTLLCCFTQWYADSFCFYMTLLILEGIYLMNRILALYAFYIGFRLSRDHYDDIVNETFF